MPDPPPRLYARCLLPFNYGYPLWTPEPGNQFLRYRRDGLRIGDVGVIIPENGSFDVFFNICLSADHPFHRVKGVPNNFVPIELDELDIAVFPDAENPGSVISTSSVTALRTTEPSDGAGRQNALTYEFNLSSTEGSLLILQEGAESHILLNRNTFRDAATRNGVDWYTFAEQKLGRIIDHDSLYLITGCYKSRSWSVAAFHEALSQTGATEFPAQFKAGQARQGNISAAYRWETKRALHWRVGPLGNWTEIPNQTVFVSGFKIAIRGNILGKKRVEVKADADAAPSTSATMRFFNDGKSYSRAAKKKLVPKSSGNKEAREQAEADSTNDSGADLVLDDVNVGRHVIVSHMPKASQSCHPSDVVNRYLLGKKPSSAVAVTHDSQWSILIENGILKPEDLGHNGRLESIMSENYRLVSQDSVVYLQSISDSSIRLTNIGDAVREAWKADKLDDTEEMLSRQTIRRMGSDHSALANRALVRARLHHWDEALKDAETSIEIQPSVTACVAKGFALSGQQKYAPAIQAFGAALRECDVNDKVLVSLVKSIVLFEVGYHAESMTSIADLITRCPLEVKPACYSAQAEMYVRLARFATKREDYDGALQFLTQAQSLGPFHMVPDSEIILLICGWRFDNLQFSTHQTKCEVLYDAGRVNEAMESLWTMTRDIGEDVLTRKDNARWITTFCQQCLESSKSLSDSALSKQNYSEAVTDHPVTVSMGPTAREGTLRVEQYDETTILHATLNSATPTPVLRVWVKSTLVSKSWEDTLVAATSFMTPRFTIYRAICEHLEMTNRITDAIECFHQMNSELADGMTKHDEQANWAVGFKLRCTEKLEHLGDAAADAQQHDDAITWYSASLSLNPAVPRNIFMKRSKAHAERGMWEDALNDANKAISLDPSSPFGYERKYVASSGARHPTDASDAFKTMLTKIKQSTNPEIHKHYRQYIRTIAAVRRAIQHTIRESPRVLINTTSGRLCDKSEQAFAFESLPVFMELVTSMATYTDHSHIEKEVTGYYRYATFSHRWEDNEPLFDKVIHTAVYDLENSPTHEKLQMFCKIVRDAGFHWAWSDVCCINKADHFVLQEALVAMFKWYQGSSLTIVFLRGVHSPSQRGDLSKSVWNTRAWPLQEYHASKVVRFYNEDWTPYLNLNIPNHKESPEIMSEMEEATGVSTQVLMAIRPGLGDIREKLCLASRRETTFVEDAAYSLLGIFSTSLPVVYGEGNRALGRLLAQLLTSSGDTSILAWTGKSGGFNSCLPTDITVFNELSTSHIPLPIKGPHTTTIASGLRASSLNLMLVMRLHDRLNELPVPFFAGQRIRLPCITFKLGRVSASWNKSRHVCRAQATALGIVEIKTKEDLSRLDSLYLIHPWIDFLLDRQPVESAIETKTIPERGTDEQSTSMGQLPSFPGPSNVTSRRKTVRFAAQLLQPFSARPTITPGDRASLRPPSSVSQTDKEMRALQLIARLRQPFGALLFTPTRQNAADYRRVASESMITVQVQENVPMNMLIENVRVLDVL